MRVLIDACLPVQLKDHLRFEEVRTARELGWQDKKNGALLALAQQQFDVVLTMDKGMPDQQFQNGSLLPSSFFGHDPIGWRTCFRWCQPSRWWFPGRGKARRWPYQSRSRQAATKGHSR